MLEQLSILLVVRSPKLSTPRNIYLMPVVSVLLAVQPARPPAARQCQADGLLFQICPAWQVFCWASVGIVRRATCRGTHRAAGWQKGAAVGSVSNPDPAAELPAAVRGSEQQPAGPATLLLHYGILSPALTDAFFK